MINESEIEVMSLKDTTRWAQILTTLSKYDVYHLPEYHALAETCDEGEAILFVYRDSDCTVAFPLLLRNIEISLGDSGADQWRDATSVYGYPGPIMKGSMTERSRNGFQSALNQFLLDQHIVAVFSRLNPLLHQTKILTGYGQTQQVGTTLSIDLTLTEIEQLARYRKGHRYDIKRLIKSGYDCCEANDCELEDFITIYTQTMSRVDATPYYFFSKQYFDGLLHDMSGSVKLFTCKHDGIIACAALFSLCGCIVQYHLAGTREEYLQMAPMKLLLDYVRQWGIQQGAHTFHLGGGVGGENDSLFSFKRGFTDREHKFSVWKHIVSPDVYDLLYNYKCNQTGIFPEDTYFPSYRNPAFTKKLL